MIGHERGVLLYIPNVKRDQDDSISTSYRLYTKYIYGGRVNTCLSIRPSTERHRSIKSFPAMPIGASVFPLILRNRALKVGIIYIHMYSCLYRGGGISCEKRRCFVLEGPDGQLLTAIVLVNQWGARIRPPKRQKLLQQPQVFGEK